MLSTELSSSFFATANMEYQVINISLVVFFFFFLCFVLCFGLFCFFFSWRRLGEGSFLPEKLKVIMIKFHIM